MRLLRVEMERVLASFAWLATWWDGRMERIPTEQAETSAVQLSQPGIVPIADEELQEGLRAYALEHAEMYRGMRAMYEARWKTAYDAAHLFLARNSVLDEENPLYS